MDPTTGRAPRFGRPQPEPPLSAYELAQLAQGADISAAEIAELERKVMALDVAGHAARALRKGNLEHDHSTERGGEMTALRDYKAQLLRWIDILMGERGRHRAAILSAEAAEAARRRPFVEQARTLVAPEIIVAEAAARAAVRAAELARDAAKAALTNHEAHVPDAAGRPAWHRQRRGLEEDFEDKKSTLEDMCAALADRQLARHTAIDVAWAELRIEKAEAHVERAIALQARLAAVQAEIDAENEADQLERADLNAARLLEV